MHYYLILIVFCACLTPSLNYKVQKRDVTDLMDQDEYLPFEAAQEGSGTTDLKVIQFKYEWTIKNFRLFRHMYPKNNVYIKSPIFEIKTPIGAYLWSIKLNKCKDYEKYTEIIEVYLNLESEIDGVILTSISFTDKTSNVETEYFSYKFDKNTKSNGDQLIDERSLGRRDNYGNWVNDPFSPTYELPTNQNDTLIILLEGTFTVSTGLNNQKKIISLKAVEEILHILYTGEATSDNLELKKKYEEKLFSQLKIENAAEIYKFLYLHGKTDLNKKVLEFIKENRAAVMATTGWISIEASSNIPMLAEIFSAFVNNSPRSNMDVSENQEVIATEKSPQEMS